MSKNIKVDAIALAAEVVELRNEIARLKGQTNWVCSCGGTDCEGQRENAALRAEVDQWASRCAAAIWMLPETVTGGELREAQDKFHRQRDKLERENAALKATLAVVSDANERGRKAWQEAHPDKQMVWPDQAQLVEWLLHENAELRAHAERLGDANDQMVVENAALRKDKARLDWILTGDGGEWVNWMYDIDEWTPELKASRDAIDACRDLLKRKEAQP